MDLSYKDEGLIIKDDLINIWSIFLIEDITINFIISDCIDFNPGDLLV